MERKVKWGVLGYAHIAQKSVLPAILKSDNSELYGVASRDGQKLIECRKRFNYEKAYDSYEKLLMDPLVEAVYIPLPNTLHREWGIKAMKMGKHVLCEKPIAMNATECEEMIEESHKNGVILMEAFMYRYTDRINKVREVLRSGIIGDIKAVNSTFRYPLVRPNNIRMDSKLGGGSLYDVGSYAVNFVGMIKEDIPVSVSTEYVLKDGVDTALTGVLKYRDGSICTVSCGFNSYFRIYSEIIGTKGVIEIPDTFLDNGGFIHVITEEGKKQIEIVETERYVLEINDVSDSIINKREPLLRLNESLRNMKVMDMLFTTVLRENKQINLLQNG